MFKFTGNLVQLNFNMVKFKKTLDETLKTQIRQAAREWLRAVIPKVPVWTGTARGTLSPLARILRVQNNISPVAFRRGWGPSVGEQFGTFSFEESGGTYSFDYEINLRYFQDNEFQKAPPKYKLRNPTPWHAFKAGDAAFKAYLNKILPQKLPNLTDFIEVTGNIKIG